MPIQKRATADDRGFIRGGPYRRIRLPGGPLSFVQLFPHPKVGPWRATFTLAPRVGGQAGDLVLGDVKVEPRGELPPDGLTQAVLRQIPLSQARQFLGVFADWQQPESPPAAAVTGRRGRPPERTGKFYRELLRERAALVQSGERHAAKVLAARHGVERATMRSWLHRARSRQ
jgi:hypothetical protein